MVSTWRVSVISLTERVLGTATSMPDCSTGAVIMKMMSSTSTTSTSGVMLMSASEDCVLPLLLVKATRGLPLDRVNARAQGYFFHAVEHFAGEVVEASAELAKACPKAVVGDNGGNSDEKSGGGGDECFGDSGSDGAQGCRTGGSETVEGIDDTHNGSEE